MKKPRSKPREGRPSRSDYWYLASGIDDLTRGLRETVKRLDAQDKRFEHFAALIKGAANRMPIAQGLLDLAHRMKITPLDEKQRQALARRVADYAAILLMDLDR